MPDSIKVQFKPATRTDISAIVRMLERLRGQGIGAGMMKWAIERARQRGCHLMQLTSHKSRSAAHRFYENLGFTTSHIGMKLNLEN
jgi:GNAT superfamily N-acetyltransferase